MGPTVTLGVYLPTGEGKILYTVHTYRFGESQGQDVLCYVPRSQVKGPNRLKLDMSLRKLHYTW